jgi:hypothetical protein
VLKLASRSAAIVLAGSALALAASLVPAQAATSGWRVETTVATRGRETLFTDVAASSPAAWAVGFAVKAKGSALPQPIIRHWTGRTWRLVTLPAKIGRELARQFAVLYEVGAASARDVWIFDLAGGYLRLDGSRWSLGQLPGASEKSGALILIDAANVFSSTDVWAFGARVSASGVITPYAAHYNGRTWSRATVPDQPAGGLITAVAAVSSRDIWAVTTGLLPPPASAAARSAVAASPAARLAVARLRAAASPADQQVVLHWTAKTGWRDAAQQPNLTSADQLVSAVAEPNGDVWFGGSANNKANGTSPLTAEWNGTRWSVKDLPAKASSADWQLAVMEPDGTGGIWAVAADSNSDAERIWHLHGVRWSQARPASGKRQWELEALALVPHTHSVWGAGAVAAGKSSVNGLIAIDGPLPR